MRPAAPAWKVVLIVEDDSDGRTLAILLAKSYRSLLIDWLPANGIGNIKRNGTKLIRLAKDRLPRTGGCVAVVIDRDSKDSNCDEPHQSIARICRAEGVPLVLCREAMEAWFLADLGCCAWLGLPQPSRSDRISDPKKRVSQAFLKKTGRTYQRRRARLEVARQAMGLELQRNESIQYAWELIKKCVTGDQP